jgi:hypothetical protein
MSLLDLQWTSSLINEKTMEQAGIIANFFAGILLGIEYFVIKDRIDQLNSRLEIRISRAYNRCFRGVKSWAKFNRWVLAAIITAVILVAIYQAMFAHSASVEEYFMYYYSLVKPILIFLRRILLGFLGLLAILFIILFITRSSPKGTLGALAILLYIAGNVMLFIHTLYR